MGGEPRGRVARDPDDRARGARAPWGAGGRGRLGDVAGRSLRRADACGRADPGSGRRRDELRRSSRPGARRGATELEHSEYARPCGPSEREGSRTVRRLWRAQAFEGCRRSTVRAVAALTCAVASLVAPQDTRAQSPRLELDISGTRIAYDTLAPLNAPSVSALTEWQRPSLFARVSASVTGLEDAGWSFQGRGDLAGWLSPFGAGSTTRVEL